ncbi:MAG TPA: XRE family transcriptional regulator [Micromonosporaceae bacterium]|nr:XRE family transcriptional regulator [Micromonosporaceae bacterium]
MDVDFSTALRSAIRRSGLSLDDIARRLRDHGTPMSVSSLSNWQTGENLPERPTSMAALQHLERLLELSPGTMAQMLPPRRPRGRWRPRSVTSSRLERTWNTPVTLTRMLAKLDAVPDDLSRPSKISQHASYQIDAQGQQRSVRVRRTMLADRDNTTRLLYATRYLTLPQLPIISHVEGCSLGRFRADAVASTCLFEFVFDRPLARGELAMVEFTVQLPPGQRDTKVTLRPGPVSRELAIHVEFHPDLVPARCFGYHQATLTAPVHVIDDRHGPEIGPGFQLVQLDPPPGIVGVRWEWAKSASCV